MLQEMARESESKSDTHTVTTKCILFSLFIRRCKMQKSEKEREREGGEKSLGKKVESTRTHLQSMFFVRFAVF